MSRLMQVRALAVRALPPPFREWLRAVLPRRLTSWTPATRTVHVRMPAPPAGLGAIVRPAARPAVVTLTAPWRSYVPRLLDADGVAGYEPETMAAFLAGISFLADGDVLDVGANVGIFSIVGTATTTARITGFEPTPQLAEAFGAACRSNGLRCAVEATALGRETGTATLYLSARTDSSNSLRAGHRSALGTVEVAVERLDDWVARTGTRPRVMKIDTETTEPDVLAGGLDTLRDHRPWIICEVLANTTEQALTQILGPLGYRFHHLAPGSGPTERAVIEGDPTWQHRDWLFTPGSLPAEFGRHYGAWLEAIRAAR